MSFTPTTLACAARNASNARSRAITSGLRRRLHRLALATPETTSPRSLSASSPSVAASTRTRLTAHHLRAFHSSRAASEESAKDGTTPADRATTNEPTWARPHKPSQDANDDVVPEYYVARKRQGDEIAERKEEEGGLMTQLLSEGVTAQTQARAEKIPVEVRLDDGTVLHPSGFEPPTPETDFHPESSKIPTVGEDEPLLTTVKVHWDEVLTPVSEEKAGDASEPSSSGTARSP